VLSGSPHIRDRDPHARADHVVMTQEFTQISRKGPEMQYLGDCQRGHSKWQAGLSTLPATHILKSEPHLLHLQGDQGRINVILGARSSFSSRSSLAANSAKQSIDEEHGQHNFSRCRGRSGANGSRRECPFGDNVSTADGPTVDYQ
jgi:hypothetical protein